MKCLRGPHRTLRPLEVLQPPYTLAPAHISSISSPGCIHGDYPRAVTVARTVTVSVTVSVIVGVALFFTGTIVNAGVGITGVEDDWTGLGEI